LISAESKKPPTNAEQFSFSSSESAMPAGPADQWAAFEHEEVKDESHADKETETTDGKTVYKGLKAYKKNEKVPRWKKQAGPTKYSSNVRITCRFDYQPDICKDWKETGYCGYGDSCKFLHDRGDYKTGWQLEREFVEEQHKKREAALAGKEYNPDANEYFVGDDDDKLPFACFICKQPFKNPVVTKCKHYFCEDCALEHYQKDQRCATCKENTSGIFNVALDIIKRVKQVEEQKNAQQNGTSENTKEEIPDHNHDDHDHNHEHNDEDKSDDHSNHDDQEEEEDENNDGDDNDDE